MKIVKFDKEKQYSIKTKEIKLESILSKNEIDVLKILDTPSYPKEIAKKLDLHEQKVYYYIKKLKELNFIEIERKERIGGTIANYYKLSSESFFIKLNKFKETEKIVEKKSKFLEPFIKEGEFNAKIVVGSPDPHGPQKARSRDGYFGMDLALFLGSFINFAKPSVYLDTEIKESQLDDNLIIIGGPIVNKITKEINLTLPIKFDDEKRGIHSTITDKTYYSDETGIIVKTKNPFNKKKKILLIAGIRNSGTKAAIMAILKHFEKVKLGNAYSKEFAKVIEGVDLDSDGIVDDVEFLE